MTFLLQLGWRNAVDFGVLAITLYILLVWAKEARALRIVLTIAVLHTRPRHMDRPRGSGSRSRADVAGPVSAGIAARTNADR
jgi:hypothetical protein